MNHVIIGIDPHKLSATIEVVDEREKKLGSGRFTTDKPGYAAMRTYVKAWPERVWAEMTHRDNELVRPSGAGWRIGSWAAV